MPSIKADFSLKDEDFEKIRKAILRCGTTSEEVLNDYIHNRASEKFIKRMDKYIPVAKIDKTHRSIPIRAKGNKWFEQENYNLAVNISNSLKGKRGSSFYYLYYVVTGTGTSEPSKRRSGVGGIDFMKKGIDEEYDNVVNEMLSELEKNIDKEMN